MLSFITVRLCESWIPDDFIFSLPSSPYHALLLMVDENSLSNSLPLDSSPSITRLLRIVSPLKNLQTLAADADLSLGQVSVSTLIIISKHSPSLGISNSQSSCAMGQSNHHLPFMWEQRLRFGPQNKYTSEFSFGRKICGAVSWDVTVCYYGWVFSPQSPWGTPWRPWTSTAAGTSNFCSPYVVSVFIRRRRWRWSCGCCGSNSSFNSTPTFTWCLVGSHLSTASPWHPQEHPIILGGKEKNRERDSGLSSKEAYQ